MAHAHANAAPLFPRTRRQFLARKLFELTGFLPIGAFLLEHFYSNFKAVGPGGAERFNGVVVELQTNPLILVAEIGLVALPLLYHAGYGLFVAKGARPNNGQYGFLRNWTYLLQRVSGALLLVYIGYHVYNTRLAPLVHPDNPLWQKAPDGTPLVSAAYMQSYLSQAHLGIPVIWLYVVGTGAAVYHFANGLWNVGIHWGLTISPRSQRLSGMVCGLVGVALFAAGLVTLLAFHKMGA
jgi:succinate dehydrogenase / fumarate reductase cytochrome b subunit